MLTGLEVQAPEGPVLLPVVRGWLPAEPAAPRRTCRPRLPVRSRCSAGCSSPSRSTFPSTSCSRTASCRCWPPRTWPTGGRRTWCLASSSWRPTPDQAAATDLALLPGPPAESSQARDWRNLAYSAQWFVFAAFAVVLWWRMLRDDATRSDPELRDLPDTPDGPDVPGATTAPRERSTT